MTTFKFNVIVLNVILPLVVLGFLWLNTRIDIIVANVIKL